MFKLVLSQIAIFTVALAAVIHAEKSYLGLNLALDYGTASVYFPNGSYLDIAKVQGGPAYRHFMRSAYHGDKNLGPPMCHGTHTQEKFQNHGFRDYLPPWLRGPDPRAQPVIPMLKALKAVTETHLESEISSAILAMPFFMDSEIQDIMTAALKHLSVKPIIFPDPAGVYAARALGAGNTCDDEEQVDISIDYSAAALTVVLADEQCEGIWARRQMHDPILGTDSLPASSELADKELLNGLKPIIGLALEAIRRRGDYKPFPEIYVHGERAHDARLHRVIRTALREAYNMTSSSMHESGFLRTKDSFDPVFAAARGIAWRHRIFEDTKPYDGRSRGLL